MEQQIRCRRRKAPSKGSFVSETAQDIERWTERWPDGWMDGWMERRWNEKLNRSPEQIQGQCMRRRCLLCSTTMRLLAAAFHPITSPFHPLFPRKPASASCSCSPPTSLSLPPSLPLSLPLDYLVFFRLQSVDSDLNEKCSLDRAIACRPAVTAPSTHPMLWQIRCEGRGGRRSLSLEGSATAREAGAESVRALVA